MKKEKVSILTLEQFMKFCYDFRVIHKSFTTIQAENIYRQSVTEKGEMSFVDYVNALDKIALTFYFDDLELVTSIDKIEVKILKNQ